MLTRELCAMILILGILFAVIFASHKRAGRVETLVRQSQQIQQK